MSSYFTEHDPNGKAIFSKTMPTKVHTIAPGPNYSMEILYSTHSFPINLSTNADMKQYLHDRENAFGPGLIGPPGGTATAIVTMGPNSTSPLHRTMTLDVGVILEGVVELHLDSGEMQVLRAGDSFVQRAGKHQWKNISPNDGVLKMLATCQGIVSPVEVSGKELETEWIMN